MKKLFNKNEKKPVLISISLIAFQSITFLFVKLFQSNLHMIGNYIDDKIPFINWFIIPYYIWYLLIFYLPYYFYKKDKNSLAKYLSCYVLSIIISSIIFIIYPTIVTRPTVDSNNILNFLVNMVYMVDDPAINCLPSMHCAISMLFVLSTFTSRNVPKRMKIFILFISILIMISTVFTKQHVVIDIITGDIMMCLIYLYINSNKKLTNKVKKLLNI